jgi:hypothetical protein
MFSPMLRNKRSSRFRVCLFDCIYHSIVHIVYPRWAYQWNTIKNTFTRFYWINSGRKLMKWSRVLTSFWYSFIKRHSFHAGNIAFIISRQLRERLCRRYASVSSSISSLKRETKIMFVFIILFTVLAELPQGLFFNLKTNNQHLTDSIRLNGRRTTTNMVLISPKQIQLHKIFKISFCILWLVNKRTTVCISKMNCSFSLFFYEPFYSLNYFVEIYIVHVFITAINKTFI